MARADALAGRFGCHRWAQRAFESSGARARRCRSVAPTTFFVFESRRMNSPPPAISASEVVGGTACRFDFEISMVAEDARFVADLQDGYPVRPLFALVPSGDELFCRTC